MAMKIRSEYLLNRILPRHFERLAEETGLAKPLVKRRVPELATTVLNALTTMDLRQRDTEKVANLIRERCERTISAFAS